jgi:hypothetical protein
MCALKIWVAEYNETVFGEKERKQHYPQLHDNQWLSTLKYVADLYPHLNELNTRFREADIVQNHKRVWEEAANTTWFEQSYIRLFSLTW